MIVDKILSHRKKRTKVKTKSVSEEETTVATKEKQEQEDEGKECNQPLGKSFEKILINPRYKKPWFYGLLSIFFKGLLTWIDFICSM